MKIDRERAAAVLQETGSVAETARRLGIHENTVRQIARINRGVCVRCQGKTAPQRTMCAECLEWDRARMKTVRKERVRLAQCVQCAAPRSAHSRIYCEAHRINSAERNEKYSAKKRATEDRHGAMRGAPWGSARNMHTKMRRLLERFGQAGRDRWDHAKGRCEACGAKYGDVAIHVHHLDENKSNNTFDNFACLCFACHRAVHLLLSSDSRKGLIKWFKKAYPDKPLR